MRKLVLFTVPFAVAVLLCVYALPLIGALVCAGAALAALLVVFFTKWKQRKRVAIALGGLCAGFLFCALYGQLFLQPIQAADGVTAELTAEVCGYPEQTRYGSSVEAFATVNGRRAKLRIYLDEPQPNLCPGDRITLRASLRRADRTRDGEEYYYDQAQGILLIASAKGEIAAEHTSAVPLRYVPLAFSRWLRQMLADCFPPDAAGLVQAFLTGDRSGLSYAQTSDLKMAGVSHMIAISGMHVSILLVILSFLTGKRRGLLALIGIPIVLFFVLSTGCSPSCVRAAVMQIIFLLAPLLGRENDSPTSLCAALLLLLLQNPYAIANLSLQLSFGAMAGILCVTRPVYQWLSRPKRIKGWLKARNAIRPRWKTLLWDVRRVLLHGAIGSVSTTLGALVFTVPIQALVLGSFSVYGILSNLLILWAVSLSFFGALVTAVLGWLFLPAGQLAGWLIAWPVRYILWMAGRIARLPFAVLTTDSPYLVIWLLLSYTSLALAVGCRKVLLPTCGILGGLALTVMLTYFDAQPKTFSVTALDVGQGQCICMMNPDFTALYDCGGTGGDTAGQQAAEFLLTAGMRRIDALVLSHYDEDHIGGVRQLLYRVDVDALYLPLPREDDPDGAELLSLAAARDIPVTFVTEPLEYRFSDGYLRIFPPISSQSSNAGSLCILYSCDGYDMLATGDMDRLAERMLLFEEELPQVELYIAGHHGSRNSSSEALLAAIRPETVLISVGDNRYGQPSEEALARFAAIGAAVYRTDECGDITIRR